MCGEGFDRALIYVRLNLSCKLDVVAHNGTERNRLFVARGSGPAGIGWGRFVVYPTVSVVGRTR